MGKAARKIKRNEELMERKKEEISQAEIDAQYGQRSIFGKIIQDVDITKWMDFNVVNMLITVVIFVFVSLTVQNWLLTITEKYSASLIAHGVFTSLLFVVVFTYIKPKNKEVKIDKSRFLYRWLLFAIFFAIVGLISNFF